MSELVRFGVAMERPLLEAFDARIARRGYENRSEALRDLVRADLVRDAWARGDETVATISLVYDHHVRDLTERLNAIQHEHAARIVSALHVHLDHEHCLEVIVARGPAHELESLADRLIGTKGVLSGEISATSVAALSPR
jgi:CopG family nickel-responsive transcriptional regulator